MYALTRCLWMLFYYWCLFAVRLRHRNAITMNPVHPPQESPVCAHLWGLYEWGLCVGSASGFIFDGAQTQRWFQITQSRVPPRKRYKFKFYSRSRHLARFPSVPTVRVGAGLAAGWEIWTEFACKSNRVVCMRERTCEICFTAIVVSAHCSWVMRCDERVRGPASNWAGSWFNSGEVVRMRVDECKSIFKSKRRSCVHI